MCLFPPFLLRQGVMWPRLASNSLCSQRWPWTLDSSASTPKYRDYGFASPYPVMLYWRWNPGVMLLGKHYLLSHISSSSDPAYDSNQTPKFHLSTIKKMEQNEGSQRMTWVSLKSTDGIGQGTKARLWYQLGPPKSPRLSSTLWFPEEACFLCSDLHFCKGLASSYNRVVLSHDSSRFFLVLIWRSPPPPTGCLLVMVKNKTKKPNNQS